MNCMPAKKATKKTPTSKNTKKQQQEHSYNKHAITAFVLGIAGILFGWILIGIPCIILAIIFGFKAIKETKNTENEGHGLAVAGLVLGFVGLSFVILFIIFFLISLVFGAMTAAVMLPMIDSLADMDVAVDGDNISVAMDFVDPQKNDIIVRNGELLTPTT